MIPELLAEYYMVKRGCNLIQAWRLIYGSIIATAYYVEFLIICIPFLVKYQARILYHRKVLIYLHTFFMIFWFRIVKHSTKEIEDRNALCEVNTETESSVNASVKNLVFLNKLQLIIIFYMIFIKDPKLDEF